LSNNLLSAGSKRHTIQSEGTSLPDRQNINFSDKFTTADAPETDSTNVTTSYFDNAQLITTTSNTGSLENSRRLVSGSYTEIDYSSPGEV